MKCDYVVVYRKGKNGKRRRFGSYRTSEGHPWMRLKSDDEKRPCSGSLKVQVSVTGGCCCHNDNEVTFRYYCETCGGHAQVPSMPNTEHQLQEFLQKALDEK